MSKTLDALRALPHVAFVDDERDVGHSIIVTLDNAYEFVDDPGCGVRGFDTVAQAKAGCAKSAVRTMQTGSMASVASSVPKSLQPFQDLVDAGFPVEHIVDQVRQHLQALKALPSGGDGIAQAIADAEAYEANLRKSVFG